MRLTAATVRALELEQGLTEKTYFDDTLAGFGIRIRAGGSKTYVVQYKIGDKHRRMVLGAVGAIDAGKARAAAKDLLAMVRLGRDPAGEKLEQRQKIGETFGALLPRFLTRQRAKLKPRSLEETVRHLEQHAKPLHVRSIEQIDRRELAVLLARIAEKSGPSAANRVRASLSAFFSWVVREGLVDANPVIGTGRAVEVGARSRVLADAELVEIWRALGDDQYSAIVRLLILTGARRDEIGSLSWSEIDLDGAVITLPPARTKNRREHQIFLSPPALAVLEAQGSGSLERDLVFGRGGRGWRGWSKSKAELDARIKVRDWTLHDFRRVLSTRLHETLGIQPHVVESLLGHVVAGVSAVYNKADYADAKYAALVKWGEYVEALVSGKRSTSVVKLRRRRA